MTTTETTLANGLNLDETMEGINDLRDALYELMDTTSQAL